MKILMGATIAVLCLTAGFCAFATAEEFFTPGPVFAAICATGFAIFMTLLGAFTAKLGE